MNEEQFNLDLRKFLKHFGVTAQREIEKAVREALEVGTLGEHETLQARAHLTVQGLPVNLVIEGTLHLGDQP